VGGQFVTFCYIINYFLCVDRCIQAVLLVKELAQVVMKDLYILFDLKEETIKNRLLHEELTAILKNHGFILGIKDQLEGMSISVTESEMIYV